MSVPKIKAFKEKGNKKTKIIEYEYGLLFSLTENGCNWTSFQVDKEILELMKEMITDFLKPPKCPHNRRFGIDGGRYRGCVTCPFSKECKDS